MGIFNLVAGGIRCISLVISPFFFFNNCVRFGILGIW